MNTVTDSNHQIMILVLLFLLILLIVFHRKDQQKSLQRLGIRGPKCNWLFGNLLDVPHTKSRVEWLREGTRHYGRLWGYYEGVQPCIVISNMEDINNALVKEFKALNGHKLHVLHDSSNNGTHVSLFNSRGARWRRLRATLNPGFSNGRVQAMYPLLRDQIEILLDQVSLRAESAEPTDMADLFQRLAVDVIGQCVFGLDLGAQSNADNALCNQLKTVMQLFGTRNLLMQLAEAWPPLAWLLRTLMNVASFVIGAGAIAQVVERLDGVIKKRLSVPESHHDVLQLLVDAMQRKNGNRSLTTSEAMSQALLMLFAGTDTTSSALAFTAQELGRHPKVQARLQDEIDKAFAENTHIETSGEGLADLGYLNQVINEVLRVHPIAADTLARKSSAPAVIADVQIPHGAHVMVDTLTVNFDPQLWGPSDPAVFDPNRFASDRLRPAAAFLAFGLGPRRCIGQQLALMEIRATIFHLLRRFSIRPADEGGEVAIRFEPTLAPDGPMNMILEPRNK